MKFVFRTDASLDIGTGHVMRCLTLADGLSSKGAECRFICREHSGNLIEVIRARGYDVLSLSLSHAHIPITDRSSYASWLGASQQLDADECASLLEYFRPTWLIVDHYAIEGIWESALAPYCDNLMVIDDLANRSHSCQLLLDQTLGRSASDYRAFVPDDCELLCGSSYALLRPEFSQLRPASLARRESATLRNLLITMGGVDKGNATGRILDVLANISLPKDCHITVVMGSTNPWLDQVQESATRLNGPTNVLVDVKDMARLMAESDLAIGAPGATSWERCCMGLPTLMVLLAANQEQNALRLEEYGAAFTMQFSDTLSEQIAFLLTKLVTSPETLASMSRAAATITDGKGTARVISHLDGQCV